VSTVIAEELIGSKDCESSIWTRLAEIIEDFNLLIKCLDLYIKISAPYVLAIVFQVSLYTIRSLSLISNVSTAKSFNETNRHVASTVNFTLLVFITCFGSHFNQKLVESCQNLRKNSILLDCTKPVNQRIQRVSDWMVTWNWELTAFKLFQINRRLILAVGGSVLTYFIFIFQMKSSERNTCYCNN
ncbi:unnamed protein product, partial [Allacma fusca]